MSSATGTTKNANHQRDAGSASPNLGTRARGFLAGGAAGPPASVRPGDERTEVSTVLLIERSRSGGGLDLVVDVDDPLLVGE